MASECYPQLVTSAACLPKLQRRQVATIPNWGMMLQHSSIPTIQDGFLRRRIKFLFITGYALDEAFNKYIDQDGLDLLQKPFRKEEIARKVREILDR